MNLNEMVVVVTGATGDTAGELLNQLSGKTKDLISTVRSSKIQFICKV